MLFTDYRQDMANLDTPAKRWWTMALIAVVVVAPVVVGTELESRLALVFITAIGAIGLNLVTGYAGQVSLGHAFFLGIGAYTAAVLGGDPDGRALGYGLDITIWLPAAGLLASFIGLLVAPIATRLRGLYLAIVTLGLVFIGEHFFRDWRNLTGGPGTGRAGPRVSLFGFRFDQRSEVFGIDLSAEVKTYFLALSLLIVLAVVARNIVRSRVGRAFAAVRDRDIAAEVMGVPLARTKATAFTVSSFYAGVAGALLTVHTPFVEPGSFGLLTSVDYLAMILIGGMATISGAIIGAAFLGLMPRVVEEFSGSLPFVGDFFSPSELQSMLTGVLIIVFIVVEPRGLFGLWVRVRNYWKAWPFSY